MAVKITESKKPESVSKRARKHGHEELKKHADQKDQVVRQRLVERKQHCSGASKLISF